MFFAKFNALFAYCLWRVLVQAKKASQVGFGVAHEGFLSKNRSKSRFLCGDPFNFLAAIEIHTL